MRDRSVFAVTPDHQDKIARSRAAYAGLLKDSVRRLVEKLSSLDQVERVSLFGSYARGRADLFTDLDVLVVMRSEEPFVERVKRLYGLVALPVDLDLVCYTPEEFQDLKDQPFLKRILQEEVVVYEKKPA
jgi:predicted nucleotidyltransferase